MGCLSLGNSSISLGRRRGGLIIVVTLAKDRGIARYRFQLYVAEGNVADTHTLAEVSTRWRLPLPLRFRLNIMLAGSPEGGSGQRNVNVGVVYTTAPRAR